MANCQITCIVKPHPQSPHEHITHVGILGNSRLLTTPEVIDRIDRKVDTFFVKDPRTNKVAYVGVVRIPGHIPYIRTHADGTWNDNLLSLDQCPR